MASERTCGNCRNFEDYGSSVGPCNGPLPLAYGFLAKAITFDKCDATNCPTWAKEETPDAQ
jgi:hypothetical protein